MRYYNNSNDTNYNSKHILLIISTMKMRHRGITPKIKKLCTIESQLEKPGVSQRLSRSSFPDIC